MINAIKAFLVFSLILMILKTYHIFPFNPAGKVAELGKLVKIICDCNNSRCIREFSDKYKEIKESLKGVALSDKETDDLYNYNKQVKRCVNEFRSTSQYSETLD